MRWCHRTGPSHMGRCQCSRNWGASSRRWGGERGSRSSGGNGWEMFWSQAKEAVTRRPHKRKRDADVERGSASEGLEAQSRGAELPPTDGGEPEAWT